MADLAFFSAYLLASAALGPLYGKLADIVGRKLVIYPVIVIFLVRLPGRFGVRFAGPRRMTTMHRRSGPLCVVRPRT